MNEKLAVIAELEAQKFFHGNVMGSPTNLKPISDLFPYSPTWNIDSWDNNWCAAFVYWCCIKAGYDLPIKYPNEAVSCNFAGCIAWEQWAKLPEINRWIDKVENPEMGDIVLFDNVFKGEEHDHIAVVIKTDDKFIDTAEGNFNNISAIVKRNYNNVRGYIRL